MLHICTHNIIERPTQVFDRLPWRAEDEVDVEVVEARLLRFPHGIERSTGAMRAIQHLEHMLGGTLHAERDAIESTAPELVERLRVDRIRIRFRRDLDVVLEIESFT